METAHPGSNPGHPLALCTLDLGLPMDDDLVMAEPFEGPDEYFLRRQREAFGTESEVVS